MTQQIEDYALIGDLRTAALVGLDGSIDWLCLPRFDSQAVFAALLGDARNGRWALAPQTGGRCTRRRYRGDSLILDTEWITPDGAVRVTDFMSPTSTGPQVVRILEGLAGEVPMHMCMVPRMDYGKVVPSLRSVGGHFIATAGPDSVWLRSDVALTATHGTLAGDFVVPAGQQISFAFGYTPTPELVLPTVDAAASLAATETYWREWVSKCTYSGPWADAVKRSLITLKALTFAPTGGILAAATTSLPEQIGGSRNWDYRFCWLRDAAFTLQAFLATGYVEEASAWRDWLVRAVDGDPSGTQIMYAVDGARHLPELTLDWLPGHAGSSPVRIGNGAATQRQNDVWGEVLDALHATRDAEDPPRPVEAHLERTLLTQLERNWAEPDNGIWEVRGPQRHFVHSKLMAWVGVDRAVRVLEKHHTGGSLNELRDLREAIHTEICHRGFSQSRRAFTQSYGSARLDASVLLMPRYGFLPWADPRMVDTVDAIQRDLTRNGLVLRYAVGNEGTNVDGVHGEEGAFLACSFWLVDALHGIGRTDDAAELFDRLLSLRNDVGLLSEEYDPITGRHLGNTPQALSHAGLVTTALHLATPSAHDRRVPTADVA
ncbi:glycoside hydrolase family 15 protein [Kribbella sp. VKM Ac-2568]|uniref:glycoside hydrolase family 15 protein n=1 Tax=Kribbella sp. VKM Ac-2568 TaxID=2512219 RepID=UPI00104476C6|nr:glycoside hydrolase family 15 protein [Kribbella sp. VKM Ac-2568]TCM46920.1 GH15 family glucan-1,4-alpha-glucosidase [Kribbella sp. VKM Ac-2568]